jgi:hypothetical protein
MGLNYANIKPRVRQVDSISGIFTPHYPAKGTFTCAVIRFYIHILGIFAPHAAFQ